MRSENLFDKERIAREFSRHAGTYDKFASLQNSLAKELVNSVRAFKISPKTILDIGTGTGEVAFLLQNVFRDAKITGCDIAPGMIERAKQKNRSKNITFEVCDAEIMPYKDKTFDLVVSNTTYQWVENLYRAFAEADRVLKPSGHFVFITFGPDSLNELKRAYRLTVDEKAEYLHEYMTVSEIGTILENAGFKVVSLSSRSVRSVYDNFREMQKTIKNIGALNASTKLPKGLRSKKRIRDFEKYYEDHYMLGDNIYATYEVIEAVCVKA